MREELTTSIIFILTYVFSESLKDVLLSSKSEKKYGFRCYTYNLDFDDDNKLKKNHKHYQVKEEM